VFCAGPARWAAVGAAGLGVVKLGRQRKTNRMAMAKPQVKAAKHSPVCLNTYKILTPSLQTGGKGPPLLG